VSTFRRLPRVPRPNTGNDGVEKLRPETDRLPDIRPENSAALGRHARQRGGGGNAAPGRRPLGRS